MTLDEAIKHVEEVAEEQKELYRLCPASESEIYCDGTKDCIVLKNRKNKGCQKCAAEHRQLAEWLKDYKRLLEQESMLAKIIDEIEEHAKTNQNLNIDIARSLCWCLDVIDKYTVESEE